VKIRKYRGRSVPEVMLRIKEELGEDAIILSKREKDGVVEVLAAVDVAIDEEPRKKIDLVEAVKEAPPSVEADAPQMDRLLVEIEELKKLIYRQSARDREIEELKKEIASIKGLLQSSSGVPFQWDEELLPIYNRLREMEVEDRVLSFVMKKVAEEELLDPKVVCREVLAHMIKTSSFSPREGVPVVFSGPPGVGKTTTLAKLASILKLFEGRDVGVVSIDTYRIGAVDQLKIYSEILGVDFYTANTPEEFERIVDVLKDRVILVDTAGRSHKDSVRLEEMVSFLERVGDYFLLVLLPFNLRLKEALKVVEGFSTKKPDGLVLTKLDEAEVYGLPVNISWFLDIPILFVTTGQRVPEDIEQADPDKLASYVLEGA